MDVSFYKYRFFLFSIGLEESTKSIYIYIYVPIVFVIIFLFGNFSVFSLLFVVLFALYLKLSEHYFNHIDWLKFNDASTQLGH